MNKKIIVIFLIGAIFVSSNYAMGSNVNNKTESLIISNESNEKTFEALTSDDTLYATSAGYEEGWNKNEGKFWPEREDLAVGTGIADLYANKLAFIRSFIYFDVNLPENVVVTDAKLKLHVKDVKITPYGGFKVVIQSGMPDHPHDVLRKEDFNRDYYYGDGGSKTAWNLQKDKDDYSEIELNVDGINWITTEGLTKFCLRTDKDIDGVNDWLNDVVTFSSAETSHPAELVVEYEKMEIIKPGDYIYVDNKEVLNYIEPFIIGPIDIEVDVPPSENIIGVKFYINGNYAGDDFTKPYSYYWNEPKTIIPNPKITVKAIDEEGRQVLVAEKDVLWYLNPYPDITYTCQASYASEETHLLTVDTSISEQELEDIKNLLDAEILFRYTIDFGDNSAGEIVTIEKPFYCVSHTYQNNKHDLASSEVDIILKLDLNGDGDREDENEEIIYSLNQGEKSKEKSHRFDFGRYLDNNKPILEILKKIIKRFF